ncbi:MAG: pyridoxamine kinase [Pleomorphochaeta sp.]
MIKNCIAIHDLCCYAKSSLSVVIPALESLMVEVLPLPTALLSSQSDGFNDYYIKDLTNEIKNVLDVWDRENIKCDCIYSGFLANAEQVNIVERVINSQKESSPLIIIDPVLGDNLETYSPITKELIERMKYLISLADVICPNATEAALLLGETPKENYSDEEIEDFLHRLVSIGPNKVVITSVLQDNSDTVATVSINDGNIYYHYNKKIDISYPGTGDLFASVLTGLLLKGYEFEKICDICSTICSKALVNTKNFGYKKRHGISVASIIPYLETFN